MIRYNDMICHLSELNSLALHFVRGTVAVDVWVGVNLHVNESYSIFRLYPPLSETCTNKREMQQKWGMYQTYATHDIQPTSETLWRGRVHDIRLTQTLTMSSVVGNEWSLASRAASSIWPLIGIKLQTTTRWPCTRSAELKVSRFETWDSENAQHSQRTVRYSEDAQKLANKLVLTLLTLHLHWHWHWCWKSLSVWRVVHALSTTASSLQGSRQWARERGR